MISPYTLDRNYTRGIVNVENFYTAVNDHNKWVIHHRLETHTSDGVKRLVNLSRLELMALNMYYYRPPDELIFLMDIEHKKLHKKECIKNGKNCIV